MQKKDGGVILYGMLDSKIFNLIKEQDFMLMGALDLRAYEWGSLNTYREDVKSRMQNYTSKYDLLGWFGYWTEKERLMSPFKNTPKYGLYKKSSSINHETILKKIFSTYKTSTPEIHSGYDEWNAIDAHIIFSQCKTHETVLDYGAGYGRLGLILNTENKVKNYIAIDSVEMSYLLQNLTLSNYKPDTFYEYFDYALERKEFLPLSDKRGAIYHLPMWKWKLIPSASVDVACSVFVFPEINEFALKETIVQLKRTLKPGGYLYLRDHLYHTGEKNHFGGHRLDTEKLLESYGFKKIYQPEYKDNVEIYGTPRVYQLGK